MKSVMLDTMRAPGNIWYLLEQIPAQAAASQEHSQLQLHVLELMVSMEVASELQALLKERGYGVAPGWPTWSRLGCAPHTRHTLSPPSPSPCSCGSYTVINKVKNDIKRSAMTAVNCPLQSYLTGTSAVFLRSRCPQAVKSGGPCHLWGITDSPSGPSGRKRFQTP